MLKKFYAVVGLTVLASVTWLVGYNGLNETRTHRLYSLLPTCSHLLTPDPVKRTYDVLLVGYLRGGTTFTGDILGLRQGNFYIYEPFHNMTTWGYYKPGHSCSIKSEHCDKSNSTDTLVLDILRGLYNCDQKHLLHSLQMWQVVKGRGYDYDVKNPTIWKKVIPECRGIEKGCVKMILSQCSNYTRRVIKVPRVSIKLAAQLLNSSPDLKIVHLLRDPRAIMNSRNVLKWTPAPDGSLSLCKKMKEDFLESDIIRKLYPERLLNVFYEDLVANPVETVRAMYDFLGYDFDDNEQTRLSKMTGTPTNNVSISGKSKTSLQVAMAWRTKINRAMLDVMDKGCNDVYKLLGYPPLKTDIDLHNSSIPLRLLN